MVSFAVGRNPKVVQRCGDAPPIPQHPRNSQALLEQRPRRWIVTLVGSDDPQVVQSASNAKPITQAPLNRQAPLVQLPGRRIVALPPRQYTDPAKRVRAGRSLRVGRGSEQS